MEMIFIGYDEIMDVSSESEEPPEPEESQELTQSSDPDPTEVPIALNVEGPVPFEIPTEQHDIVQIESNNAITVEDSSPASSRATTPTEEIAENNKKRMLSEDEEDDEGQLCPICFDNWTNTGEHRICSLKCGHLFGFKCIIRWLNSQDKKSCPTCKVRAKRSDLRYIYAKKLVAVDVTELELVKQELNQVLEEKNRLTQTITCHVMKEKLFKDQIADLKHQIDCLKNSQSKATFHLPQNVIVKLYKDKSLELCKNHGCRVFDTKNDEGYLMVSMKSPNGLFAGYGLKKVNVLLYKPLEFVPLHSNQIRDIRFHPFNNWVLTVSMDKSFKVLDTTNNCITQTASNNSSLWCCCWDARKEHLLYVGSQAGTVIKYDLRNIAEPMDTISINNDFHPVVSIASIPSTPGGDVPNGGIVCCKLNSLWLYEDSASNYVKYMLPLHGPFVDMKYQIDTKQLLVSSRPNNQTNYARHIVCTLEKNNCSNSENGEFNCNIVHCFQGGGMQKLLSRSCFVTNKDSYVAAHHEASKTIHLWSVNKGERALAVPVYDAVLDLGGFQSQNDNFLISLTDKRMDFFKFNTN